MEQGHQSEAFPYLPPALPRPRSCRTSPGAIDFEASAPSRAALTRANEAGDVHIQHGDVAGIEASVRGQIHARSKLVGGVQQLDALIRVQRSVVRDAANRRRFA
jgi:hypothetical protein